MREQLLKSQSTSTQMKVFIYPQFFKKGKIIKEIVVSMSNFSYTQE